MLETRDESKMLVHFEKPVAEERGKESHGESGHRDYYG